MLVLSHKKLLAWQKAIALVPLIYRFVAGLPPSERFVLGDQIRRASLSISNNLAEGCARKSKAEKNRFFEIARASAVEVDNCLEACLSLRHTTTSDLVSINEMLLEIFRLTSGLIASSVLNTEEG